MKNRIIYKYPVLVGENIIDLPKGAIILSVKSQNQIGQLWAMVNPNNETEKRVIAIVPTDKEFNLTDDTTANHIETFTVDSLGLIFHAFEIVPSIF